MSKEGKVATSQNIEKVLLDEMMDIESDMPIMMRLDRIKVDRKTLKDITSGSAFEEELYEHCRGQILLPAMSKILHNLTFRAATGDNTATRTYLELMKMLNAKQDINVNLLQYKGLSDAELDRRLEAELSRHGIDLDNPQIMDGELVDDATE